MRLTPAIVAVAAALTLPRAAAADTPVTFTRDVAPIVWSRCSPCHRPGEVGPFPLLTYDDVRKRARQIVEVTASRVMPPWPPEPGHGVFAGERRLTEAEMSTIKRWVDGGAIEGNERDLPPRPEWKQGWQLGTPDVVISMKEPYTVPAAGPDVFRKFVLPIPIDGTKYVRGIEFRPGNARVLHHAIMHLDPTGEAQQLAHADHDPGAGGMLFTEGISPEGHFLGWSPGVMPSLSPPDLAWPLERGTALILQLHLMPTGKAEPIQASVGLFFAAAPPSRVGMGLQLGSYLIDIPPGERSYVVEDSYVLPVDVELHSIYPHAHYLGKQIRAFAVLRNGTKKPLIWIKDWDFYWQGEYRYASPVALPKGTTIAMEYEYDNSETNPRNPNRPPVRVRYGGQSGDEMANLWMQVVPANGADLPRLKEDYARKSASRYVAGYTAMLQENPDNPAIHRGLGLAYLRAGKINEAITHLGEALRLAPPYAADAGILFYNLGNAEAARGNLDAAAGHFQSAIEKQPDLAEAYNNLGVMRQSAGRLAEAGRLYEQALAIKPTYAEAHNNLGVILQAELKLDDAIMHFREAVRLNPSYTLARENLTAALREREKK
jgi:tetratricopeptide (TPR) repeat protein